MRRGVPRLVVAVALSVILSGCGGSSTSGVSPEHSTSVGPTAATSTSGVFGDPCAAPAGGRIVRWQAAQAQQQALVYPPTAADPAAVRTAVVVTNMSGSTLCPWLPALAQLRRYGTVWLHDTEVERDVVADLRRVVARAVTGPDTQVLLVGASMGAKASLVVAGGLPATELTGVVALSPESVLSDGTEVLPKLRGTSYPSFLAAAMDDQYGAYAACRSFAKARPAVTTFVTLPDNSHGTDLLVAPDARTVLPAIDAFVMKLEAG